MRWLVAAGLVALVSETPPSSTIVGVVGAASVLATRTEPQPDERIGERVRDALRREIAVPAVPKKVHLKKDQVTSAIARLAARYLDRPMLSETIRTIDGKRYSFCVEPHYHAPGSGLTPEGWHKGVTVYGFEE